jgi:Leucine-rich repeat (LRR) protein
MGNQLTSVPTTIRTTKLLRELYLSSNNITQINSNAFGNHQFLTELYLNNLDQLSVISDCAFCGLTGLNVSLVIKNLYA